MTDILLFSMLINFNQYNQRFIYLNYINKVFISSYIYDTSNYGLFFQSIFADSQQNQLMLRWCQSVNVYNIENHYHFYGENEQKSRALSNIPSGKLKAGTISVSSTKNSKQNSKSCLKKGLKLSKTLINPEDKKGKQEIIGDLTKQYSSMALYRHAKSSAESMNDIAKTRSMQSQKEAKQKDKQIVKVSINRKQYLGNAGSPILDFKQQNQLLLTHLYSTQSSKNKRYPQLKNNKPDPIGNLPAKTNHDHQQLSTTRNINPDQQTKSQFQASESLHGYEKSRYNTSRSVSVFNAQQLQNSNERVYFKILEMSRGEAREASIILSNILSRSVHHSYCQTRKQNTKNNEKRLNLQDKLTILSHNDAQSEASLKIEQSELYDSDPKNNFTMINKQMKTPIYTVNLAIQNYLKCIVSLKEICFREMSVISQEVQVYQFLDQNLSKCDNYRNILELYQIQMANGSYILIKQPFTLSAAEYIKNMTPQQFDKFMKDLEETARSLLLQLAHHLFYPTRLLSLNDFVLCESVIKFHDMSIFKQMKDPIFEIETLMKEITDLPKREGQMEGQD